MKKIKPSKNTDDVDSVLDSVLCLKTKNKSLYDGFKKNKTVNFKYNDSVITLFFNISAA